MFVNYAHRGASEYAPENTMPSFELGLTMGANGIETDLQETKDGKIVMFHDNTIDDKSNGTGAIADYTYEELLKMDFGRRSVLPAHRSFCLRILPKNSCRWI